MHIFIYLYICTYLFIYFSKLAVIVEETTDITADFFKANIYNFDQQARNDGWKYGVKRKLKTSIWAVFLCACMQF